MTNFSSHRTRARAHTYKHTQDVIEMTLSGQHRRLFPHCVCACPRMNQSLPTPTKQHIVCVRVGEPGVDISPNRKYKIARTLTHQTAVIVDDDDDRVRSAHTHAHSHSRRRCRRRTRFLTRHCLSYGMQIHTHTHITCATRDMIEKSTHRAAPHTHAQPKVSGVVLGPGVALNFLGAHGRPWQKWMDDGGAEKSLFRFFPACLPCLGEKFGRNWRALAAHTHIQKVFRKLFSQFD